MGMLQEIVRDVQHAARNPRDAKARRYHAELREAIENKQVRISLSEAARFSPRQLFEMLVVGTNGEACGYEVLREASNEPGSLTQVLMEAGDAVSTAHFSQLMGQLNYSMVLDAMENPEFIGDQLMPTKPASSQYSEVIPGVSLIGDRAEDVGEGEDYPHVGLSEEYITAPAKVKDGFIIPITEEVIWEDKSGLILQRANQAAEALGITMEKEKLDTALGITTSYRRNGGAAQAAYGDTHTNGDFDNLVASNALADYTDIENVELAFDAITDLNTGEPVMMPASPLLVVPTALKRTAQNIKNSTLVKLGADSGAVQMMVGNPVSDGGSFTIVTSPYVKGRTSSASTWFYGDFMKALAYLEVWPVGVFTADRASGEAFRRDVITQIKVRRKGVPAWLAPWKVCKSTA